MTPAKLKAAKDEARRFLARVQDLDDRAKTEPTVFWGCSQSGAVRRASMDLSRALAALRRGDR